MFCSECYRVVESDRLKSIMLECCRVVESDRLKSIMLECYRVVESDRLKSIMLEEQVGHVRSGANTILLIQCRASLNQDIHFKQTFWLSHIVIMYSCHKKLLHIVIIDGYLI